jgi:hypothetical protein
MTIQTTPFPTQTHRVDFCVVGGGMAGLCAAVAAARRGAQVVLMHERPVLGGNASSEIRMWVCGAHGANNRETGILEEIMLDNLHRNPTQNFSLWDSILYEKARFEPNLTLLLNCSCTDAVTVEGRLRSVTGWQLTTQTWHTVEAALFADCSGDSILAPLTGAEYRVGREARREFGEDIEPEESDRKTMGMSCLIQARETDRPQTFIPPSWANVYRTDDDLPNRDHALGLNGNFWWLELGGEQDSIHDTETIRDNLLKAAFGVWDHIKNHGDHGAECWTLEWLGFLPGKRESRRYLGDHILTQNDVRAGGRFDDLVAYGGWPMDDHHPAGLEWPGIPTVFHGAPSPYGIPYRSLYSRTIDNLFFAGRNISVTHAGLSSTRVIATCAIIGQAVGTAAALAVRHTCAPRDIYREDHLAELQQALMDDDCYLPWQSRAVPSLTRRAGLTASEGNPEPLRNGLDRPDETSDNGWTGAAGGGWVTYTFEAPTRIHRLRFIFDSDLNRDGPHPCHRNIRCSYPLQSLPRALPSSLAKAFRIEAQGSDGVWKTILHVKDNHQRLACFAVDAEVSAIRFVSETTWGSERIRLFAWDVR